MKKIFLILFVFWCAGVPLIPDSQPQTDDKNLRLITVKEMSPIVFPLGLREVTGGLVVDGKLRPLPVGSRLDRERGIFYWLPGPGFIGPYRFRFVTPGGETTSLVIRIGEKTAAVQTGVPASENDPFGEFSTPTGDTTVSGAIAVTGWALDNTGVESVKIYRQPVSGSPAYIGDAVFIEGARPDVETAYPGYPDNSAAGWGYMMLTHFLPDGGNGTFTFLAVATDTEGNAATLGVRTVTCDNAGSVKPFGTIDLPGQGEMAAVGNYRCQGWVLTPPPNKIPEDGSTIRVIIDGQDIGNAVYNLYRPDIAALFPGYANSAGALAYFDVDTSPYAGGLHTIQWTVTDDAGNTDGIGSRYFSVAEAPPETADYYVSKTGNDTNDGTSENTAFLTIARAFQTVQAGETIQVLAGTYPEEIVLENLGSSSGPVTLKGKPGTVILDGGNTKTIGIWCENCTNLVFEDLEFRNYTDIGIGVYLCSTVTFRNLTVHHNGFAVQLKGWGLEGYGIDVDTCSDITVEDNRVYQNGPNPQTLAILMGTGINTYQCTDCVIRNNESYQNIGGGILVEDGVNVLVEGNNVYENDLDASVDEWWDGGLWVDGGHDITIRNNTFTDNLGPGIEISDEDFQNPYGYVLENNVSTGNYYGIYIWNFGGAGWPAESVLKSSGNQFTGNTRKDIWIDAWARHAARGPSQ